MELLMMLDIAHGAGASEVHAIIPYFSYARSDKKDAPRISITARLIADLLQTAGVTHIMTMTLHSPQVHGFFSVPTDPLTARPLFVWYFKEKKQDLKDTIVISPDVGRSKPAARFAARLGISMTAAQKQRISDDKVVFSNSIERQVEEYRRVLIYDDEIATGATVLELCKLLIQWGIEEIAVICTHACSPGTHYRTQQIYLLTDRNHGYVPIPQEKHNQKLKVISVAPVFGEAIWRNSTRQSIGDLFTYSDEIIEEAIYED
jgi:ribose-phosphate pyrophosphokinase